MAVRKIQKTLHVGKQLFVNAVTPTLFAEPPIGIDHHVVERNAVPFVIQNQLFCLLFAIRVILGIPAAEGGQANKLTAPRQFHIQAAELFRILSREEQIKVLRVFLNDVFPFPFCGIAAFGDQNTRTVGNREYFGRVSGRRKFAAVFQRPIGINRLPVFLQAQAAERAAPRKMQGEVTEAQHVLF